MDFTRIRSEIIFGLALAFSIKAVVMTDWPSVIIALAFFGAHWVERFFSANTVEKKLMAKSKDLEEALRIAIEKISHIQMAQGLTSRTFGQAPQQASASNGLNQFR